MQSLNSAPNNKILQVISVRWVRSLENCLYIRLGYDFLKVIAFLVFVTY